MDYSDSTFIEVSAMAPVNYFGEESGEETWEYRQVGDTKNPEAVIIFPGIRESSASYYRLLTPLKEHGFRVLVISYTTHESFKTFSKGFNYMMVKLGVRYVHLIGNDFGGFICLQVASSPQKTFLVKSISLINSYVSTRMFKPTGISSISFLSFISSKKEIIEEIENVPDSKSLIFVMHEIEMMSTAQVTHRVMLRRKVGYPLDIPVPEDAIMVVETNNRVIEYPESVSPMSAFPKAKYGLLKSGGDWPHLEEPEELLQYLLSHINRNISKNTDGSKL